MPIAEYRITRVKLSRSPLATGPGPAWKWLYNMDRNGKRIITGGERLDNMRREAARRAKENGETADVVLSWEPRPFKPCR